MYSFSLDKFLHFKRLCCFYFCHNNTFAFVYYCIVCMLYQHICWIILFCVIIIFYPLFIVSLSMILFVTIVLKNIYSTNNFRITSKNEFFFFEKFTSFGGLLCGPGIVGSAKATREQKEGIHLGRVVQPH